MTESVECVVIGAGVIGLAAAQRLSQAGLETIVLERERQVGTATSSRNSEVIHAGIYYPPASLKARLCVSGKHAVYAYCRERGVEFSQCGKLIVATDEGQLDDLRRIRANAAASGVDDLEFLERREALDLEPQLRCAGALLSPSTGIIDSHGLMLALQGDVERAGGMVALGSPVLRGRCAADGIVLAVGGDAETEIRARFVVNSGGLHAQQVALALSGLPADTVPPVHYARGNYYSLEGRSPFRHLVYPVPENGGLGVHLTVDLGGRSRFGPDVEWVGEIGYDVDPGRSREFYAAIRKYWPALPDEALSPAYSGIRPKLHGPGEAARDFEIHGPERHGVAGLVNLFGIESPGLTASLAIAYHVRDLLLSARDRPELP
jgi:L-2-hydroxyglutarate oxidase LhgO